MSNIASFVSKHRKQINTVSILEKISKLPWYKRPIEYSAFTTRKAKNGKYYARHKEWSTHIWIGPYNTQEDVNRIINSYVVKSAEKPLNKITPNEEIHSVYIEDSEMDSFF